MFDWMLPEKDAIAIVKKDHDAVTFEKAGKTAAEEKIVDRAVTTLKIHAILEEEIFYPTVRASGKQGMNEADEEHHVAQSPDC